ncbi:MAG: hypothetical protein CMO80_17510 [Verrucomicrobiales bacterium]|nr:hypothetical protein [Verrucomicrobiales bacterium]
MKLFLAILLALTATIARAQTHTATLDPDQIVPGTNPDPSGSPFAGTATFNQVNSPAAQLSYTISLPGMDLDGNKTPGGHR